MDEKKFEKQVGQYLSKKFKTELLCKKVKIRRMEKSFDFVSGDGKIIGDAKYYKNIKTPAAKFSTIAEYVWLLEKTKSKQRFIVFGRDREVPIRWLKRFGSLTTVTFYFFSKNKLEKLN